MKWCYSVLYYPNSVNIALVDMELCCFPKLTQSAFTFSIFWTWTTSLRPVTLSKKRLWRCFPVNFVKFLRTPFFIEHRTHRTPVEAASVIRDSFFSEYRYMFFFWKTMFRIWAHTILLTYQLIDKSFSQYILTTDPLNHFYNSDILLV